MCGNKFHSQKNEIKNLPSAANTLYYTSLDRDITRRGTVVVRVGETLVKREWSADKLMQLRPHYSDGGLRTSAGLCRVGMSGSCLSPPPSRVHEMGIAALNCSKSRCYGVNVNVSFSFFFLFFWMSFFCCAPD